MASYGNSNTILSGTFMIIVNPGGKFSVVAVQESGTKLNISGSTVSGYVLPSTQTALLKTSNANQSVLSSKIKYPQTQPANVIFNGPTIFNDQTNISYTTDGVFTNIGGLTSYWVAYTGAWDANGTAASNRQLYIQTDGSCIPSSTTLGENLSATANGSGDTVLNAGALLQMKNNGKFIIKAQQNSDKTCTLLAPSQCMVMQLTQGILIYNETVALSIKPSSGMNVASIISFTRPPSANTQTVFTHDKGSFTNNSQATVVVWVGYQVSFMSNQTFASNRRAYIKTDTSCIPLNARVGEVLVGTARGTDDTIICGSAIIQVKPGGRFQVQVMQNSSADTTIKTGYCGILIL
jgi:hypothetical protein